ncbi:MAG: 30S ribosomal protein S1 [Spirochaetales bacterium]|nr:30S ribosomal protein S1 [Spirochaetales bacterium]
MKDNQTNNNEESFAELFEKSTIKNDYLEPGQAVDTEIVAIAGDTIFLQLNGKSEGVLAAEEMTDKEGNLTVAEGDRVQVFFLKADNGEMRFTTRISSSEAGQAVLQSAYEKGVPVEGAVEKEVKGGFEVKLGQSRAFCPYSQMGTRRVEDASEWIGRHLTFKITELGERGRNIIVSHRAVLEAEREKQKEALTKTLEVGMKVKGTVRSLRDFGAFIDLSGIQALLPISEISHERVNDIESVLTVGQEIEAEVLKLDWKNDRISLSMKALAGDPWEDAAAKYREGSIHKGKVARIADFGAFVTLEPGLDGLVHVSELATEKRNVRPRDVLEMGEEIRVRILSIDRGSKRISLKHVGEGEEDTDYSSYSPESSGETYNPFAALLKDRAKK